MNISKELLSKVENVGVEVYDIEHFSNNILYKWVMHYVDACNETQSVVQKDKVNIYELAFRTREYLKTRSKHLSLNQSINDIFKEANSIYESLSNE